MYAGWVRSVAWVRVADPRFHFLHEARYRASVIARPRFLVPVLALLVGALTPSFAHADERAEARRHFRAGLALVSQRRFTEAIAEFEEANRILPNANVLYNIARAYADAEQYDRAIEYYQRYLGNDVADRVEVERLVRDLEQRRRATNAPSPTPPPPPPPPGPSPTVDPNQGPVSVGNLTAEQTQALRTAAQTILQFTQGTLAPTQTQPPPPPPTRDPAVVVPPVRATPSAPVSDDGAYEEQLVTATLNAQNPLDSPNASTVITAQDIRLSGITSVPELLRRAVGVDVMEIEPSDYQVGIRGFNRRLSNRVLVLVDGRSVSLDFIGLTLWPVLPVQAEEIERIEIIRGPGSALYGADAFSGVVNIITRAQGEGRSQTTLSAGNGSRLRAMTLATGRAGGVSYRTSAGYDQQQSFGRLVEPSDLTYRVTAPDLNNALQGVRADVDLSTRVGQTSIRGGFLAARDTIWFNAIGPLRRFYTSIAFVQPWVQIQNGGFTFRLFSNHVLSDANEYVQRIGITPLANRIFQDVIDLEVRYARNFSAGTIPINVILGASYRLKHISWNFLDADHVLNHFAGYTQVQARLLPNLSVLASVRVDSHPVLDAPVFSPRAAVVFKPTERRALRLSAGTSFRTPTMAELYLDLQNPTGVPGVAVRGQGGEVYDNGSQRLRPESSISVDFGFQDRTSDVFQYEINGFYTRGVDLIELSNVTFDPLPGVANPGGLLDVGRFRYFNDPFATAVYGAELSGRLAPFDGLDIYSNYTLALTSQTEGTLRVGDQRTPQHKLNVGAQLRTSFGLDLSVDGHLVSSQQWREQDFDTARGVIYSTYGIPTYFLLNARIGFRAITDRLEFGITGTNLTDNQARQHPFGSPIGARVMGTVSFRY
jgi:outer membrane receptor for ferrienterochelin and colicin